MLVEQGGLRSLQAAYVSIRQHTSAYVSIRGVVLTEQGGLCSLQAAHVSIRQHMVEGNEETPRTKKLFFHSRTEQGQEVKGI